MSTTLFAVLFIFCFAGSAAALVWFTFAAWGAEAAIAERKRKERS